MAAFLFYACILLEIWYSLPHLKAHFVQIKSCAPKKRHQHILEYLDYSLPSQVVALPTHNIELLSQFQYNGD